MPDQTATECFSAAIQRFEDGSCTLSAQCVDGSPYEEPVVLRHYLPGTDLGQIVDEAARLMCGWAAMGQWGFIDAGDALRRSYTY